MCAPTAGRVAWMTGRDLSESMAVLRLTPLMGQVSKRRTRGVPRPVETTVLAGGELDRPGSTNTIQLPGFGAHGPSAGGTRPWSRFELTGDGSWGDDHAVADGALRVR